MKSYKEMNSAILSQVTMISTEKLVNLIRGARLEKVALDSVYLMSLNSKFSK